jgi:dihydropteroate synthase-like protein
MVKKLKILLITGKKSFIEISNVANLVNVQKNLGIECVVKSASVDVSAFINKNHIESIWNELKQPNFNFILISGFIPWDTSSLVDRIEIPVYKGTKFSGNLLDLLINIRDVKLSTKKAADSLLRSRSKNRIVDHIENKIRELKAEDRIGDKNIILKFTDPKGTDKFIGRDFPPLLFAEVVNAPKISEKKIHEKITHYVNSGADVIDIGTIIHEDNSDFIRRIIPSIKKEFEIMVSIDSVNMKEIIAGIESGADFILSIDDGNINEFLEYDKTGNIKKDLGLIVIPLKSSDHLPVEDPNEKIQLLINLAEKLTENGFKNIFYDPLLKTPISPGFIPAIQNYILLNDRLEELPHLKYPLFMGFNNVFELIDSDSVGINVLLSLIASELNCGGILSTEYSAKSLGAISETQRGINLSYLAKISNSPPINLGIDAFFSKNKRKSPPRIEDANILIDIRDLNNSIGITKKMELLISIEKKFIHDKTGYFKIYANHNEKVIEVLYFPSNEIKQELSISSPILIKGNSAESIYKVLDKLGIVFEISHAFYIGKELSKAEYALQINAAYFEDVD